MSAFVRWSISGSGEKTISFEENSTTQNVEMADLEAEGNFLEREIDRLKNELRNRGDSTEDVLRIEELQTLEEFINELPTASGVVGSIINLE